MSSPAPGNYYIISNASMANPDSDPLVVNYTGVSNPLNVKRLQNLHTQVWAITAWKDKRVLSPKVAPSHRVAMGRYFTNVCVIGPHPDPPPCWSIKGSDAEGYTIQNCDFTGFWNLRDVVHGATISFGKGTGTKNENWLLLPADD